MICFLKLNITFALLLAFTVTNCISQDSATAAKIKYYTHKVEKYLDKEKALSPYYSINTDGISIYESLPKKLKKDFEFHISFDKIDNFNLYLKNTASKQVFETYKKGNYNMAVPFAFNLKVDSSIVGSSIVDSSFTNETKKLEGLKIAIDPGHIAGDMEMGDIEKKCLTFKCDSVHGLMDSIAIAEGVLTFATAKLLKDKLEAEGAEVFMTRPFNSSSAFGLTFDDWLKTHFTTTVDSLYKEEKITLAQKQFFWVPGQANGTNSE